MYFVMIFTYYDITKAQIELLFCAVTTTYHTCKQAQKKPPKQGQLRLPTTRVNKAKKHPQSHYMRP